MLHHTWLTIVDADPATNQHLFNISRDESDTVYDNVKSFTRWRCSLKASQCEMEPWPGIHAAGPANMKPSPNVDVRLAQRSKSWPNINPASI